MTADYFEALLDSPFLRWFDLNGKPALVEILSICQEEISVGGGIKKKCPILKSKLLQGEIETIKPLILNRTNLEAIAAIHGPMPSKWIGQSIVLFDDWTEFKKERVRCIRVRARKMNQHRTNTNNTATNEDADQ